MWPEEIWTMYGWPSTQIRWWHHLATSNDFRINSSFEEEFWGVGNMGIQSLLSDLHNQKKHTCRTARERISDDKKSTLILFCRPYWSHWSHFSQDIWRWHRPVSTRWDKRSCVTTALDCTLSSRAAVVSLQVIKAWHRTTMSFLIVDDIKSVWLMPERCWFLIPRPPPLGFFTAVVCHIATAFWVSVILSLPKKTQLKLKSCYMHFKFSINWSITADDIHFAFIPQILFKFNFSLNFCWAPTDYYNIILVLV